MSSLQQKIHRALAKVRGGELDRQQLLDLLVAEFEIVENMLRQAPQGEMGAALVEMLEVYQNQLQCLAEWVESGGSLAEADVAPLLVEVEELDGDMQGLADEAQAARVSGYLD